MSRGDNENPLDFSHTSEWQDEHAEAHAPVDRGNHPARRPSAYEKARAKQAENDYRFSNGEGNEPKTAFASEFARHARNKRPVIGKYKHTPEGPAIGGKHGKIWNGRD
jgi:hypothetical protein